MSKFGETAIEATKLCRNDEVDSPMTGWKKAASINFPQSQSSQEKGCPRSAYLGLCENGLVRDIPSGDYLKAGPKLNKQYAISAVDILRQQPHLTDSNADLWEKACGEIGKTHNSQMDVVIALWKNGDIQ